MAFLHKEAVLSSTQADIDQLFGFNVANQGTDPALLQLLADAQQLLEERPAARRQLAKTSLAAIERQKKLWEQ